ncbi:hypothetical protein [Micromonospora cathayae]|uniref:Uncharacterized protein n=1 Tax=Micromonospora cathayae TaxID=3028804 RepID=A0ABY7ZP15_9ACTN|nr:hypothetical protein [Micromonospora sp. HUAS 3]WDZ84770.1 hypothetical protein PVK37_30860 [Micromonospora sp. HUAS 3]
MPAKRNPKKKPRTPSPKPSLAELTPPDPAALEVAPAASSPAGLTPPAVEVPAAGLTPPPAPKTGPPARGAAFANGKGRVGGAGRRYAFRRS